MRISSITVAGFRNIAETRLEPGGVAGLVAPNNYGKSNVLDAVAFALGFIAGGPGERRRMMTLASCRPLNPRLADEDFRFSVAFEDEGLGAYRHVEYGFAFRWPRSEGDEPMITAETLRASHRAAGQKVAYLERREGAPYAYRAGRATRSTRRLHLDGAQLAVDVLTAVAGIGINPVVRRIRSLAFRAAEPLVAEDPRLPARLHRLAQADPEAFGRFECAVLALFPEIERIDVEALETPQARHDGGTTILPYTIKDAVCRL
ncbi:MAG: hypothetical protein HUK26_04795, partial [Duodenibacillus sp.]|nr:hypothetical protein [Duodenibacillus sp.]